MSPPPNPCRRLLHWGPISVLCIVKVITASMIHVMSMWWPPHASVGALLHTFLFLSLASSTLYHFFQATLEGPGFVPAGWTPENDSDTQFLQYCTVCKGYKAPRSHHCRKCGYCVKKMDHHCPWINCCVGNNNHGFFILFLTSAVLGCLHATIVLPIGVYHALNRIRYLHIGSGPIVHLSLWTLLMTLLSIGCAVGVVLAVGALLYWQVRGMIRNQTTIEEWIVEKATSRREENNLPAFVFPYDIGWRRNVAMIMRSSHDGLQWPVRAECGQYDLTLEQISQKTDKRSRSRLFTATKHYDGRWVPLLSRPRAALGTPCTDEYRLPLQPADVVRATRQRRHWLFGEKVPAGGAGAGGSERGPRGWFPRDSVVPTDTLHHGGQGDHRDKRKHD